MTIGGATTTAAAPSAPRTRCPATRWATVSFVAAVPKTTACATWPSPPMTFELHPKLPPARDTGGGDGHGVGCCTGYASDRRGLGRVWGWMRRYTLMQWTGDDRT